MTATNGRLPPMHETPDDAPFPTLADVPAPAAPVTPPAPPEVRRVTLSPIEVDAVAQMEAALRSACAAIIASRAGEERARWAPVRDEHGRIVAFEKAGEPEKAEG